jgi:mannosyltransferase OCH1-like enzyme
MPIPGSKAAPKKFKGDFTEVKKFIKHYKKLCDYNQVTSDKDRCETVSQYTSHHVTEFIEGLDSYENLDWNALKADILKYYDADLDTKYYKRQDLVSYVKAMRGQ